MAVLMEASRDDVIRELTRHCGDGRLTLDELEDRIGEAYAATTEAELQHALRELPAAPRVAPVDPPVERSTTFPPLPPLPPLAATRPVSPPLAARGPEWEKSVGTLFTIGGFVLLFNGMFWLAIICWFVLPGLVLNSRRGGCR